MKAVTRVSPKIGRRTANAARLGIVYRSPVIAVTGL
jgi:hypothetical protein